MKNSSLTKLKCPYCGGTMIIKNAADFFGDKVWHKNKDRHIYVCQNNKCDCYVLAKKNRKQPCGVPADGALRHKRIIAHQIFDNIWKSGIMSRYEAYRWLQFKAGMSKSQAHIANFSQYMCDWLIEECNKVLDSNCIKRVS